MAYANERIIHYMNSIKAPYNVNRLSQEVAVRVLNDRALYEERVATILKVCLSPTGKGLRWGLGVRGYRWLFMRVVSRIIC